MPSTRVLHVSPAPAPPGAPQGPLSGATGMESVDIYALGNEDLGDVTGIVLSGMCDQRHLGTLRDRLEVFVRDGGRILINGHVIEPFLPGLPRWRLLPYGGPEDLGIERAAPHPVWDGVDLREVLFRAGTPGPHSLETLARIGVAGFYGRGYAVDLPDGATVINTIGQLRAPIDYVFPLGAGEVLVHSGLDLGVFAMTPGTTLTAIGPNLLNWLGGHA